jgi:spoIIIJ-associated protein
LKQLEIAVELIDGLIKRMGLEAEIAGSWKDKDIYLEIKGDKDGILIGRHGRTLEALELLLNRMVNRRVEEPVRVVLDINHYREKRVESLQQLADHLGTRVRKEGKAITIGPFNAQDRRIIHIALQQDPLVKTESIGEGPLKKISILPEKK